MTRLQKGELQEWVYDTTLNFYSGLIPERPVNPPEPEPVVKRSCISPWRRTFSIVLDLGDLGERGCSVIYRQCPEITIDSVSLDGVCIHKYLLVSVMDKIREKIQESLSDE